MKSIDRTAAERLVDFAPGKSQNEASFQASQLDGAVAAYNMLARNRVAYLADEVGLGKTYVALGVIGLMRHFHPEARVMVIAPRENIQLKWIKELRNFTRANWLVEDNRVKGLDGEPVRKPVPCHGLLDLGRRMRLSAEHDFFLRMTSFSPSFGEEEAICRIVEAWRAEFPWIQRDWFPGSFSSDASIAAARDAFGRVLNAIFPDLKLLVVDEGHNLKHGSGFNADGASYGVSTRNRLMSLALGHRAGRSREVPLPYAAKAENVLILSATPFEGDYADLFGQLDVLGISRDHSVTDASGGDPLRVGILEDPEAPEDIKRRVIGRILVRRVSHMRIGGRDYSKNMYRRMWRRGGVKEHDHPMKVEDTEQKLILGLIQKKVTEVVGEFQNRFQIGMLSSFESFSETLRGAVQQRVDRATTTGQDDTDDSKAVFSISDQTQRRHEKLGIDSEAVDRIAQAYRGAFDRPLPHPKLDAVAFALGDGGRSCFVTGEKALVFVRRVRTVPELREKLCRRFDQWMERKLKTELPAQLHGEVDKILHEYRAARPRATSGYEQSSDTDEGDEREGKDSLFAWFFRGKGPRGRDSAAAFQKNRLSGEKSHYSLLFEEDYVSWLLGRPEDVIAALAERTGVSRERMVRRLISTAFESYSGSGSRDTDNQSGLLDAYQTAGLTMLAGSSGDLAQTARIVLSERFRGGVQTPGQRATADFPRPERYLGLTTFVTELARRPELNAALLPGGSVPCSLDEFREREIRRELLSAQARLGVAYIDLYLAAVRMHNAFDMPAQARDVRERLAIAFLDELEKQRLRPGFHAYYELSTAARDFSVLQPLNFPDVATAPLQGTHDSVRYRLGQLLQAQSPVLGMYHRVNRRFVRQFRMPGFPLLLVSTDILAEGEDLHTYCRNVYHYGITWTPSSMEQRTGRVDRINGLLQRRLDGRADPPTPDELLQVYFPHLADTVEVLQVKRVLNRLDRFIEMVYAMKQDHMTAHHELDVATDMLAATEARAPEQRLLESAYPPTPQWMSGELTKPAVDAGSVVPVEKALGGYWKRLVRDLHIEDQTPAGSPRRFAGVLPLPVQGQARCEPGTGDESKRKQRVELSLRSQPVGGATLLRCTSVARRVPKKKLDVSGLMERLIRLQQRLDMARIYAIDDEAEKMSEVGVTCDRMVHIDSGQFDEVEELVTSTATAADRLERFMEMEIDGLEADMDWQCSSIGSNSETTD